MSRREVGVSTPALRAGNSEAGMPQRSLHREESRCAWRGPGNGDPPPGPSRRGILRERPGPRVELRG
eukprot:1776337-Alexandrium_andersonii.AAC.1